MEKFDLNEIKVAVINRNLDKLKELSFKEPSFSTFEEAKEILFYIQKANEILKEEKKNIFNQMQEIKKLRKFYESQQKGNINFKF